MASFSSLGGICSPSKSDGVHEWPDWEQGQTQEITLEAYDFYLDLLPPRWMSGDYFAYGEGSGCFSIFWKERERYFVRHLTQQETERFCSITRATLHL